MVTDARGNATTYTHDVGAKITRVLDPLGRHRDADYGSDNNVTVAYDAMGTSTTNGKPTTYTYDAAFNPTKATRPTGASASATYANATHPHLPDTTTDEQGNTTANTYDSAGNLTKTQDVTGGTTTGTTVTYGVYGNTGVAACGGRTGQTGQVCTVTDGRGNTTSNTYDAQGNLATVTPPAPLGASRYAYDPVGRVTTATDGKGQTTRYSYDGMGRTTQVLYAGTTSCAAATCLTYTYDADGNQTSQTDGPPGTTSGTISYAYDLLGRQTGKTLPGQTQQTLTYDSAGNLTSISEPGGTTTYRHNTANELTSLSEPGGSCTSSPTVRCTTFTYNNNGARTTTTYPTSPATVLTVTPDDSGRTTQIKATSGTTVQSDFSYTYATSTGGDTALTQTRTDRTPGSTSGRTTSYGYNSRNYLKTATETDSAGVQTAAWSYVYDKAGNRTSATVGTTTNTFTYNAANEITARNGSTTGWAHDANGTQTAAVGATTRTSTVNAKDQHTGFTVGTSTYNTGYLGAGQDERTAFGATTFTTSPVGLASANNNGNVANYVRDPDGTPVAFRYGGASYYYLLDGQGSVVGLVDSTGVKRNSYSYDPYGISRAKTEAVPNNLEYTGGLYDSPTGLYKLGIRYYDPTLGRFTQPDPTAQDPHYTYAGNNPVNNSDLSGGSFRRDVAKKLIEAAVGGVVGGAVYAIPGVGLLAGAIAGACAAGAVEAFLDGASARTAGYQCAVNAAATGVGGATLAVLRRTVVPAIIRTLRRF